jgi:hypothetical protein
MPGTDPSTWPNRSSGVEIHANTVNISGDVIGGDKNTGGPTPPPASPPLELAIRFGSPTSQAADAPLTVSVHVLGLGLESPPFDFAAPLDDKALDELRWYLEVYPHWPRRPGLQPRAGHRSETAQVGQAVVRRGICRPPGIARV